MLQFNEESAAKAAIELNVIIFMSSPLPPHNLAQKSSL